MSTDNGFYIGSLQVSSTETYSSLQLEKYNLDQQSIFEWDSVKKTIADAYVTIKQ